MRVESLCVGLHLRIVLYMHSSHHLLDSMCLYGILCSPVARRGAQALPLPAPSVIGILLRLDGGAGLLGKVSFITPSSNVATAFLVSAVLGMQTHLDTLPWHRSA